MLAFAAAVLALCGCSSNSPANNRKPCKVDGDCSSGQVCSSGACSNTSSCTPPGNPTIVAATSPAGPAQQPASCVRAVQQASTSTQKLGTHAVGDVVTFDVAPGTGSLTIFSQGTGTPTDTIVFKGQTIGNSVVPTRLKDPAGNTIYDDSTTPPADPSGQLTFYAAESVSTGAMTLPNTTS